MANLQNQNGGKAGIISFDDFGSDQNIASMLIGTAWTDFELSYGFPQQISDYGTSYHRLSTLSDGFEAFSSKQQDAVKYWLDQYASVSGLSFVEMSGEIVDGEAVDSGAANATLRFANSNQGYGNSSDPDSFTAYAYYPYYVFVEGGDSWYDRSGRDPDRGDYHWHTIGHEIGHTLGLAHSHEDSGNGEIMETGFDHMAYTLMSYRSYEDASLFGYRNDGGSYAQTLMIYDIAAIQHLYGANFDHNSGNTTYKFDAETGEMFINGVGQGAPVDDKIFLTIWDGGGRDTYNFKNFETDLIVDLSPGGYVDLDADGIELRAKLDRIGVSAGGNDPAPGTYEDGYYYNYVNPADPENSAIKKYAMAEGHIYNALQYEGSNQSLIERAIGGSGDDVLIGNQVKNWLYGKDGDDQLFGGAGDDLLSGGSGQNYLDGGEGRDTASFAKHEFGLQIDLGGDLNNSGDVLVSIEGLVGSAHDDYLVADIDSFKLVGREGNDHLVAAGGSKISLVGGDGDDIIETGNGRAMVRGDAGNDTIIYQGGRDHIDGGNGKDTLSFADLDDGVTFSLASTGRQNILGSKIKVKNVENFVGTAFDDVITGSNGANSLDGGGGDDRLTGGAGADIYIFGYDFGSDLITDFEQGVDMLAFDFGDAPQWGSSLSEMFDAGLQAAAVGEDLVLSFNEGEITLAGLGSASLEEADILFV